MKVQCTRPTCSHPLNVLPDLDDKTVLKTIQQKYCSSCGMPLILDGRYLPLKLLGQGGFGAAYLACDRRTPTTHYCVVKQFQPSTDISPQQLQIAQNLFDREAEVLERLGDQHDQIPRLLAFFPLQITNAQSGKVDQLFYIVQEYIDGKTLEELLKENGYFSEAEVLEMMKSILKVLQYVHENGAIHRDVKPSNIMRHDNGRYYLLDFGTVKQVTQGATMGPGTGSSTGVFTPGYAPPEQMAGKTVYPSTDLYSLAVTALTLLTGKSNPLEMFDGYSNQWQWRQYAQVSDRTAAILDRMLESTPNLRFQSAAEVLTALLPETVFNPSPPSPPDPPLSPNSSPSTASPSSSLPWKPILAVFLAVGLGGGIVWWLTHSSDACDPAREECPQGEGQERLSTGDQLLIRGDGTIRKQDGIEAYAAGNYEQAIADFEASLRVQRNDPEVLIYLNNARIGDRPSYLIAISIPIESLNAGKEMLRGVAQAQDEVNKAGGIGGVPLKVLISTDTDKPESTKKVAQRLVDNPEVLGVIGHFGSDASLGGAEIYNASGLVMISPTSTSTALSGVGKYIFRTVPSDDFTGRALSSYMLEKLGKQKAAVFFNGESNYSKSLQTVFKTSLFSGGGDIVSEVNLKSPGFNAKRDLEVAIDRGAEVLVLVPNSATLDQAFDIIKANQRKLPLLGGDSPYRATTLEEVGAEAKGMVLAVPWHILADPGARFPQAARKLWGGDVSWRTALAYDASQALIAALQQNPTRQGVQEALSSSSFSAEGASGAIRFLPSGDRNRATQLVQIAPGPRSGHGFDFVPVR